VPSKPKPTAFTPGEFVKHHQELLDATASPAKAQKYREQSKAAKTVEKLKKAKGVTK
jgi:hypothetical protein